MATSKSSDVASAINNLLHLEEADQASLLDVIGEYFTSPAHSSVDSDSDSDNELDHNVAGNCVMKIMRNKNQQNTKTAP